MHHLIRASVRSLRPYIPGDQPTGDVIKLNTNESPYPPSPRVGEALAAVAAGGLNLYPDGECLALRQALGRLHGFAENEVFVGNGSAEVLHLAIRAFTQPGQSVGYFNPSYTLYAALAESEELQLAPLDLDADFDWHIPSTFAPGLFILANPNSPTGRLADPERVRAFCQAFPGVVLVDEAYVEFSARHCLHLAHELPNVVVSRTLSKAYSLANARVGCALGRAPLIEALFRIKDSYNVSGLDQTAGLAAVQDQAHLASVVGRIRATRERVSAALRQRGFAVVPSEANFIFVSPPRLPAETVFAELKRRSIFVRYFPAPATRHHLRLTIGTDAQMDRVLAALDEILAGAPA